MNTKKMRDAELPEPFEMEMPTEAEPDGNAFVILGRFNATAKTYGWTPKQISSVTTEAMRSDYQHLRNTIGKHTTDPDTGDTWFAQTNGMV